MMPVCAVRCASHPFTAAGATTLKMKIQKVKLIEQPNKMAVAHEMTVVLDDGVFRCNNVCKCHQTYVLQSQGQIPISLRKIYVC